MLPYYGLFDNLAYRVDGATVTLFGQVSRPSLKQDAEARVREIEGVDQGSTRLRCYRFLQPTTASGGPNT